MSNITISSTTSSQEELDHAASENWRQPFVPRGSATPAEAETPGAEETPAETAGESETPENPESKKPEQKPKSKAQRTIDKLTARNHAAEERAAKLEKDLAELRSKQSADKSASAQPANQPPQLKDFKTPEEWADARDAWKEQQEAATAEQERTKAVYDAYNKGVSEARGRYEDWDETVDSADFYIPQSASVAIIEAENGPDVCYYLAKHPDEAESLFDLSPVGIVRAISRISDKLASSSPEEKPKPKSQPPAPLATVGASATRSSIPLDQLPPRDYIRVRNRQERDRRGR